jgi:SAM-dependent methyltransferase
MKKTTWQLATEWEAGWHETIGSNTLNEENKQITYAEKLGLTFIPDAWSPYWIDGMGKTILDIGCGETSLLLKTKNLRKGYGIDPLLHTYPAWVRGRYQESKIMTIDGKAEDAINYPIGPVDEVWIYNCLQHVEDPKKIIDNAKFIGKLIRIFEWVDTPPNIGHPWMLTEKDLNEWLGGEGKVEMINSRNAVGKCYFGVFNGDNK